MFANVIIRKNDTFNTTCFYPVICHICKEGSIKLKRCGGCKMISYCNVEHQKEHWPEHKGLCKAIREVRKNFATELSECQETRTAMKLLREKVTSKLGRKLKQYEIQMFKYQRMCWLCHEQSSKLLEDCLNCLTSFCSKHKNNHNENTCSALALAIKSDIALFMHNSPKTLEHVQYISHEDVAKFCDMKSFIKVYDDVMLNYSETSMYGTMECEQSIHFTRPLTVFHGLQILDCIPERKKSLVIHIIAAYEADAVTLPSWETILHLFPTVRSLKLVIIVPDLNVERFNPDVCHNCKRRKKKLFVEWHVTLYKDYIEKSQNASHPDLVVGFHVGLYEYDDEFVEQRIKEAWMSSVQAIATLNCPLFLTFYSKNEAKLNADKINFVLEKEIEYFYCKRNPFASLRPNRWFADNTEYPVFYENNYLLIYKSLYS